MQVLEGAGTGERAIQPWEYNSWDEEAWRKRSVRKFIHVLRMGEIAARWFRLSRNFQFRVATFVPWTSKRVSRERVTRCTSRWGNPPPPRRLRKLDERKDGRFRGITFNQEVTCAVIPEKKLSSLLVNARFECAGTRLSRRK